MELIRDKLVLLLGDLAKFADQWKNLPALAYTHFQPAQPTTVGKRATPVDGGAAAGSGGCGALPVHRPSAGLQGTTGSQASFMELFDGDEEMVRALDQKIAEKMASPGFILFPARPIPGRWTAVS